MHTEGSEKKTSILKRWFPDRQVYFRSNGEVRFLTLSTTIQAGMAGTLAAFFVWVAFSTAHVFTRDAVLEAKQEQITELQEANTQAADDMDMLKSDIISRANNLEHRQTYLEGLVESDPTGELDAGDNTSEAEPEAADADKEAAAGAASDAMFWAYISGANDKAPSLLDLGTEEFSATMKSHLELVRAGQDSNADRLSLFADGQLLQADDMLAPFKLKALDLVNAVENNQQFSGQGGPYIPLAENDLGVSFMAAEDSTYYIPYPGLHENWTRLLKVYTGFQSIPLLKPAADYYFSSGFGRRTDPVTQQTGWHPGVDLAGWKGTDVFSAEDGVVKKAGYFGSYGKYVEVDHGNGFLTRYGHLSKITVNRGDTVNAGEVIGKMGCTGRCTGTHLHYEVVFNNKIRNPRIFMEAPEDVQETKRQSLDNDAGK